jgi:hypothetical protein
LRFSCERIKLATNYRYTKFQSRSKIYNASIFSKKKRESKCGNNGIKTEERVGIEVLIWLYFILKCTLRYLDRFCGPVVRNPGYRPAGPGSIPGTTRKKVGLERGPLNLVSTTEELLERKVAAPV